SNLRSSSFLKVVHHWIGRGQAYFWWHSLSDATASEDADALLLAALQHLFPEVDRWSAAQVVQVSQALELNSTDWLERSLLNSPENLTGTDESDDQTHDSAIYQGDTSAKAKEMAGSASESGGSSGTAPLDETDKTTRQKETDEKAAAPTGKSTEASPVTPDDDNPPATSEKAEAGITQRPAGTEPPAHFSEASYAATTPIDQGNIPAGTIFYLDRAGVVLAHPFLAPLFTALGYWQDDAFADELARQRAVYLTHYLATGERSGQEENMLLSKLLCGWPVTGAPVQLTEKLTDTECQEADDVLRAVIGHWTALGQASPEGLREGFFARQGRMEKRENGWSVTVERKAQDILLGQLPWGISLVQAPWHERMIKVEW
ncbi:MAG: contractile injection system tape measure protein, partial [Lewinella sp.]